MTPAPDVPLTDAQYQQMLDVLAGKELPPVLMPDPPPELDRLSTSMWYLRLHSWSESVKGQRNVAIPAELAAGPRPEIDPANYQALKAKYDAAQLLIADLRLQLLEALDQPQPCPDPLPAELVSSPAWSEATLFDRLVVELLGLDHPEPAAGMSRTDIAAQATDVAIEMARAAHARIAADPLSSAYSPQEDK